MIYNVWSWYDVKITQNYLLVLFLINIIHKIIITPLNTWFL